jgi:hypothetical protein
MKGRNRAHFMVGDTDHSLRLIFAMDTSQYPLSFLRAF